MGGWRRYLELKVEAKTGLSSGLVVGALLAIVFGTLTFGFILVTVFVWLASRFEPLIAALALSGFFLVCAIVALVCCLVLRRRTIERAELALAARRRAALLDPKLLAGAIQVSRAFGWRKVVPVIAVGILAAGIGMQWFGREDDAGSGEERAREEEELARAA
jgi:FtsH-binding integral membrane protein